LAFERQAIAANQAGLQQPGLDYAGLTSQQHNPASAVPGGGKRLIQLCLLALAPDQIP
jgi:hypothetical protein